MMSNKARSTLFAGVLACLVLAGCPGENRFTAPGTSEETQPRILLVDVPDFVTTDDVLDVTVSAVSDDAPMENIRVTLSRAFTRDTTVTLTPPAVQVERRIAIVTPSLMADNVLVVRVIASTGEGTASDPVEVEIPVLEEDGGPGTGTDPGISG